MRRWKNLGLAAMLVIFTGSGAKEALAEEAYAVGGMQDCSEYVIQEGGLPYVDTVCVPRYLQAVSKASAVTVEDVIYQGLLACEGEIDLSSYKLKPDQLKEAYTNVLNNHAELFYVDSSYSYYYLNASEKQIKSILPKYIASGEELEGMKNAFSTLTGEILSQVEDTWSDLEKALYLHDYLCVYYGYDTDYKIYDAYHMLTEKKGVCQAYTQLYAYLLHQCGIKTDCALSEEMNHIWNMIFIEGNWYHVDVTWDDALTNDKDVPGRAYHKNFMRNETGIQETGHKGWVSNVTAASDAYEQAFWKEVNNSIVYTEGEWYCIEDGDIQRCSPNEQKLCESVYKIEDTWFADNGYYWLNKYSGIATYDGLLYFNTPEKICSYDLSTKEVKTVFQPNLTESEDLYGLYQKGNIICYVVATTPNEEAVVYTYELETKTEQVEVAISLDDAKQYAYCNGKKLTPEILKQNLGKTVTVRHGDSVLAKRDVVGTGDVITVNDTNQSYQIIWLGDVTGDGLINASDLEAIQKHILRIENLEGVYFEAGSFVKNGGTNLTALDMEHLQKYLLRLITEL